MEPSKTRESFNTSGFWPRVRARALRAPVPRQMGRCAVSYLTPKNILNLSNLGRPSQGPFSFHRNTEAIKYEVVAEAYTTQPNSKASSRVLYMYFSCMAG